MTGYSKTTNSDIDLPKTPTIEMNERNVAEIYCVSEKIIIVEYTAI